MTEQEIKETVSGTAARDPLWRAMNALLDQHFTAWNDQALGPAGISEARTYAAGAAYGLQQVRDALEQMRIEPCVLE